MAEIMKAKLENQEAGQTNKCRVGNKTCNGFKKSEKKSWVKLTQNYLNTLVNMNLLNF